MTHSPSSLHLFEAFGVELEYMMVEADSLNVCPKVDKLFESIAGHSTSLVQGDKVDMDNELAAHVVELKNPVPTSSLMGLAVAFQKQIKDLEGPLGKMGCRLLPTAMHPWMDPHKELKLWPLGDHTIYNKLHEIFDCRGHGWANLQSTHLNLPFTGDEEFHLLHSAIRPVLALVPTLAASSPYADGKFCGVLDKRLLTYRDNSKKVFSVTGHVIPEVCTSQKNYHKDILEKMWADLAPYDPEGVLRYEWMNARGAIARFDRMAIEIRLVDIQETPWMDLALVSVIISVIQNLVQSKRAYDADKWNCQTLKLILERGIHEGEQAQLSPEFMELFGLRSRQPLPAYEFWQAMTQEGLCHAKGFEKYWQVYLSEGTLASRMLRRLGAQPAKSDLYNLFDELGYCLTGGEPFMA